MSPTSYQTAPPRIHIIAQAEPLDNLFPPHIKFPVNCVLWVAFSLMRRASRCATIVRFEPLFFLEMFCMSAQSTKIAPKNFAVNRQAGHYYHLLEKFEAGIELTGTEVKSIREGKVNLKDGYAIVRGNEIWLVDCHVSGYAAGSYANPDPLPDRRLLLRREEINQLKRR